MMMVHHVCCCCVFVVMPSTRKRGRGKKGEKGERQVADALLQSHHRDYIFNGLVTFSLLDLILS